MYYLILIYKTKFFNLSVVLIFLILILRIEYFLEWLCVHQRLVINVIHVYCYRRIKVSYYCSLMLNL